MKLFDFDYFALNEICHEIGTGCFSLAASLGFAKHQVDCLQLAVYQGLTPAHMMMNILRSAKPKLSVDEFAEHLQACELFNVSSLVEKKLSLVSTLNGNLISTSNKKCQVVAIVEPVNTCTKSGRVRETVCM